MKPAGSDPALISECHCAHDHTCSSLYCLPRLPTPLRGQSTTVAPSPALGSTRVCTHISFLHKISHAAAHAPAMGLQEQVDESIVKAQHRLLRFQVKSRSAGRWCTPRQLGGSNRNLQQLGGRAIVMVAKARAGRIHVAPVLEGRSVRSPQRMALPLFIIAPQYTS